MGAARRQPYKIVLSSPEYEGDKHMQGSKKVCKVGAEEEVGPFQETKYTHSYQVISHQYYSLEREIGSYWQCPA